MGVVYEAEAPDGRRVAIKLVLTGHLDPAGMARFKREAELLAEVEHPNIVRVHELGQAPEGPYLVTELIDGTPAHGPVSPEQAVAVTVQIAEAVQALHDIGLIHRDLKPDNVLVRPEGGAVLLDFGVVRELAGERLTHSGDLIGSPSYTPPEQADGKRVGPRADVYGLGGILYHLLTGRPPFDGPHALAVLTKVMQEPPTPPSSIREEPIPRHLERACLRALSKQPADRHASALAFAEALQTADDPGRSPAPVIGLVLSILALTAVLAWAATRPVVVAPTASTTTAPTPAATATAAPPAPSPTPTATPAPVRPWSETISDQPAWLWTRFLTDTRIVVTTSKRWVQTWDLETGERLQRRRMKEPPRDIAVAPGGGYALVAGYTQVRRVDAEWVQRLGGLEAVEARAEFPRVMVLPDGRFVLCKQGTLTLWRFSSRYFAKQAADLGMHKPGKYVGAMTYLPHRKVLITGTAEFPPRQTGRELRAHDIAAGGVLTDAPWSWLTTKSRAGLQAGGAYSLDGDATRDRLASGAYLGGRVQVFELAEPRYVTLQPPSFDLTQGRVRRVRFDPQGRLFVLWGTPGHTTGELQRWDPERRRVTWRRRFTQGPTDMDLSPDGRRIVIGFFRGGAEVFPAPR